MYLSVFRLPEQPVPHSTFLSTRKPLPTDLRIRLRVRVRARVRVGAVGVGAVGRTELLVTLSKAGADTVHLKYGFQKQMIPSKNGQWI